MTTDKKVKARFELVSAIMADAFERRFGFRPNFPKFIADLPPSERYGWLPKNRRSLPDRIAGTKASIIITDEIKP